MTPWRFFATRLHGDGTETLIGDLPLESPRVMRSLSAPGMITGQVSTTVHKLIEGGRFLLREWDTAIYAEHNGRIVWGAILGDDSIVLEGSTADLDGRGFSSYPKGIYYDGEQSWVQVDPADLVRHAWNHVQGKPGGNLGVVVDGTATPVRVGWPERDVEFETGSGEEVEFTAGPVKWNWWSTHDLGSEISKLLQDTPMEYLEDHYWDGEIIRHRLRLGYPSLGRRQHELRFVVGENVLAEPIVGTSSWASEVVAIGAGEGREMRRGVASRKPTRLRRPVVIVDKTIQSNAAAQAEAAAQLRLHSGGDDVHTIVVREHPSAPLGSWVPGDEILIQGSGDGYTGGLYQWHRVVADDINPDGNTALLTTIPVGGAS